MKTRMNFRLSEEAVRALNGLMVSWGCTGTEVVERAILSARASGNSGDIESVLAPPEQPVRSETSGYPRYAQRIRKPSERGLV